jgi:hypothetical protein
VSVHREQLISDLFEVKLPPRVHAFDTLEKELVAVSTGIKPLAKYTFLRTQIERYDDSYSRLMTAADAQGLIVVHDEDNETGTVLALVVRTEDLWRAQAYAFFWNKTVRANRGWCGHLEILSSQLLGYTEEQIKEWMEFWEWSNASWQGKTVYLLLTQSQARDVARCAHAHLPSTGGPLCLFWYRGHVVMKRDASTHLSDGGVIARAAIARETFEQLIRPRDKSHQSNLVLLDIGVEVIEKVNRALCSKIQVLQSKSWESTSEDLCGGLCS